MSGRPEENRELRSQKTWELKNIVLSGLEKKHLPLPPHRIFSGSTQLTLQLVEMSWIQTDRHKHRCMSWVNFIHSAEDSPTQSVWQCDCFPENNVFWMLEKLSPSYIHRTGWAWRCLISGSYAEVNHHMGMVRPRNINDWVYGIYWSQKKPLNSMNSPCWVEILWKEVPFYSAWLDSLQGKQIIQPYNEGMIHGAVTEHLQKNDKCGERLGNECKRKK